MNNDWVSWIFCWAKTFDNPSLTLKVVAKSNAGDSPDRSGVAWLSKSKKSITKKLEDPAGSTPGSNSAPTTHTYVRPAEVTTRGKFGKLLPETYMSGATNLRTTVLLFVRNC